MFPSTYRVSNYQCGPRTSGGITKHKSSTAVCISNITKSNTIPLVLDVGFKNSNTVPTESDNESNTESVEDIHGIDTDIHGIANNNDSKNTQESNNVITKLDPNSLFKMSNLSDKKILDEIKIMRNGHASMDRLYQVNDNNFSIASAGLSVKTYRILGQLKDGKRYYYRPATVYTIRCLERVLKAKIYNDVYEFNVKNLATVLDKNCFKIKNGVLEIQDMKLCEKDTNTIKISTKDKLILAKQEIRQLKIALLEAEAEIQRLRETKF